MSSLSLSCASRKFPRGVLQSSRELPVIGACAEYKRTREEIQSVKWRICSAASSTKTLSLAEPRLLGRGEGLGNCLYVTCSRGMFDCVTYNRTDITLRNARPHMNNTEPLDLPSELLRD